jgi:hypothetical protein
MCGVQTGSPRFPLAPSSIKKDPFSTIERTIIRGKQTLCKRCHPGLRLKLFSAYYDGRESAYLYAPFMAFRFSGFTINTGAM